MVGTHIAKGAFGLADQYSDWPRLQLRNMHALYRLQEVLPSWAKIRVLDTTKPLHTQVPCVLVDQALVSEIRVDELAGRMSALLSAASSAGVVYVAFQVADAKVLIPTTGQVPAEAINAAKDLRLIVNPAAGSQRCCITAHHHDISR